VSDPLVLAELSRTGVTARLTDDTAAALAATKLVEVRTEGSGRWRLLPNGRVGAVRIDGIDVQVRPKVGVSRLLFLLGYASDPGFRPEDVQGKPEPDLWPALGESLARQAERALVRGVRQGYVTVDDSLAVLRGRVRVADQITRRPGMMLPLEVQYDEYSTDIPENQILRTALRRIAAVPRIRPDLRARLVHLDARLSGVTVLRHGVPTPPWRTTRVNASYAPAIRLAEIVLRNQSTEPGPGGVTIAAFVVNMAKVFEDFLLTAMREALAAYPGDTRGQYPVALDHDRSVAMNPDIVHIVNNHPVAVFDAKYKLEDPTAGYPNADLYQMLAYCTALRLNRGWLVYAHGTNGARHRVRHTHIELIPHALDLAATPTMILKQVDELARMALMSASTTALGA
jgi:5-methylcytosine-specific restriction enzyme subunit McrC